VRRIHSSCLGTRRWERASSIGGWDGAYAITGAPGSDLGLLDGFGYGAEALAGAIAIVPADEIGAFTVTGVLGGSLGPGKRDYIDSGTALFVFDEESQRFVLG